MATSNRLRAALIPLLCFAGGAAGGSWIAHWTAAAEPPAAAPAAGAAETTAAAPPTDTDTPKPAPGPKPVVTRSAPLPPRELPVADYFDEMAEQALQGDALAARRLADDMYECANNKRQFDTVENILERGGRGERGAGPSMAAGGGEARRGQRRGRPENDDGLSEDERRLQFAERFLQRAQETEKRCAGITDEQIARSGEFIRAAALAGDNAARLCYALAPNEWNRDLLSPEWQDWSQRWKAEAPDMVRQAFEGGLPEAAAVLSTMYSPWKPSREARPWAGQLGDQPYWAYAYAAVARQNATAETDQRLVEAMNRHAARLTPAQIAQADAWASAASARIRFEPPATGRGGFWQNASLCDSIRRSAGRL